MQFLRSGVSVAYDCATTAKSYTEFFPFHSAALSLALSGHSAHRRLKIAPFDPFYAKLVSA
jgi:hypothetical protein